MLPSNALPIPEEGVVPGPGGLHPNATWPTPSGITLQMATTSCMSPIKSLSVFNVCAEYTGPKIQTLVEGCTLDILVRWPMLSVRRNQASMASKRYAPADGHFGDWAIPITTANYRQPTSHDLFAFSSNHGFGYRDIDAISFLASRTWWPFLTAIRHGHADPCVRLPA